MYNNNEKILSIESLLIGYISGRDKNILLPALNGSSLKGELIAVIGRNGIGKSTLLRTITGLQPALGGNIILNNRCIADYSRHNLAQNVAYISTEPVRVSNMTVHDLVSLGRYPHTNWSGKIKSKDHEIIMDSIEKAGIQKLSGKYIFELSDGERQRAMVARVLAQDTNLLVMDEPTAFLDVRSKYEIIHLLHDLSRNRDKTVLFSTHDLHTALNESDKIWLLLKDSFKEGAPEDLIIDGSLNRLFNDSQIEFNSSDGSFSFRSDFRGQVFINGTGIEKYWTVKAVNRAGYAVSNDNTDMKIDIIKKNDETLWITCKGTSSGEFRSVYDLVTWLNRQKE